MCPNVAVCKGVVFVKVHLTDSIFFHFFPVKEKLTADPESEIATTSLRVSLLCPVNMKSKCFILRETVLMLWVISYKLKNP